MVRSSLNVTADVLKQEIHVGATSQFGISQLNHSSQQRSWLPLEFVENATAETTMADHVGIAKHRHGAQPRHPFRWEASEVLAPGAPVNELRDEPLFNAAHASERAAAGPPLNELRYEVQNAQQLRYEAIGFGFWTAISIAILIAMHDATAWYMPYIVLVVSTCSGVTNASLKKSFMASLYDPSLGSLLTLKLTENVGVWCLCRGLLSCIGREIKDATVKGETQAAELPESLPGRFILILGLVDVVGSLLKAFALLALTISEIITIQMLVVPLSIIFRICGLGKQHKVVGSLTWLMFLVGVAFAIVPQASAQSDYGHASGVQLHRFFGLQPSRHLCICSMLVSVIMAALGGNLSEWLIHRKDYDSVVVAQGSSLGALPVTVLWLAIAIALEGVPNFQQRSIAILCMILTRNAIYKACKEVLNMKLVMYKSYTWKRLVSIFKIVPAMMFEAVAFYAFHDTVQGKPINQVAVCSFMGAVLACAACWTM